MKKIYFILILMATLMLNSCTAFAQICYDDEYVYHSDVVTYTRVIERGTPCFIDNVLVYYLYNNVYYYPYVWNGHHYFKPYAHIQPRDFRFHPEMNHKPDMYFIGPKEHKPYDYGIVHRDRGFRNQPDVRRQPVVPKQDKPLGQTPEIRRNNFDKSSTRNTMPQTRVTQPQRTIPQMQGQRGHSGRGGR